MSDERFDVFENEVELRDMISKLQKKGMENMSVPDDFWFSENQNHKEKSLITA